MIMPRDDGPKAFVRVSGEIDPVVIALVERTNIFDVWFYMPGVWMYEETYRRPTPEGLRLLLPAWLLLLMC